MFLFEDGLQSKPCASCLFPSCVFVYEDGLQFKLRASCLFPSRMVCNRSYALLAYFPLRCSVCLLLKHLNCVINLWNLFEPVGMGDAKSYKLLDLHIPVMRKAVCFSIFTSNKIWGMRFWIVTFKCCGKLCASRSSHICVAESHGLPDLHIKHKYEPCVTQQTNWVMRKAISFSIFTYL